MWELYRRGYRLCSVTAISTRPRFCFVNARQKSEKDGQFIARQGIAESQFRPLKESRFTRLIVLLDHSAQQSSHLLGGRGGAKRTSTRP